VFFTISEKHGIVNGLSTIYTNYAKALYELGELEKAHLNAEKAISIFEFTGISWRRSIAENLLVLIELQLGNVQKAALHYDNGVCYAMKMRNPYEMGFMYRIKCEILNYYGDDVRVQKMFQKVFEKKSSEYVMLGIKYFQSSYDGYEKDLLIEIQKNN